MKRSAICRRASTSLSAIRSPSIGFASASWVGQVNRRMASAPSARRRGLRGRGRREDASQHGGEEHRGGHALEDDDQGAEPEEEPGQEPEALGGGGVSHGGRQGGG